MLIDIPDNISIPLGNGISFEIRTIAPSNTISTFSLFAFDNSPSYEMGIYSYDKKTGKKSLIIPVEEKDLAPFIAKPYLLEQSIQDMVRCIKEREEKKTKHLNKIIEGI